MAEPFLHLGGAIIPNRDIRALVNGRQALYILPALLPTVPPALRSASRIFPALPASSREAQNSAWRGSFNPSALLVVTMKDASGVLHNHKGTQKRDTEIHRY
jgi:hypothetical protein